MNLIRKWLSLTNIISNYREAPTMMEMNVDRYPDVVDVKQFSPVDEKACGPSFRALAMQDWGAGAAISALAVVSQQEQRKKQASIHATKTTL
jgi:hypothetical protein